MVSRQEPILREYFMSSEELLLSEYNRSKSQRSSQNLGNNREQFCNFFLSNVLPHRLKVTSGEIWDSKGNRTGQLDTIVVKEDVPSLDFGKANTYLAEGVFSVVEVKSNLTRDKLVEAIQTLKPVHDLHIHQEGLSILGKPPNQVLERPLICIFAYDGAQWDTLAREIDAQNAWDSIDLISILGKGSLIRNSLYWRWEEGDVKSGILQGKGAALGMLYFCLSTFLTDFIARNISIRPYFEPFKSWSDSGNWTVIDRRT